MLLKRTSSFCKSISIQLLSGFLESLGCCGSRPFCSKPPRPKRSPSGKKSYSIPRIGGRGTITALAGISTRRGPSRIDEKATGIGKVCWAVKHVCIEVGISPCKADGIFREEALYDGGVLACPMIEQARAVMLPSRKLVGIGAAGAGDRRHSKRVIGIFCLNGTRAIR